MGTLKKGERSSLFRVVLARNVEPQGGLTPSKEVAAAAAAEATCARHRRHATVSSASLRSPWGRRAIGRVGARRFDAAGVSISPTPRRRARRLSAQAASHRWFDAGPAAACAAGLRPPPIRPAAWEASVGGVRGFRWPGPGACVPRASSSASAAGSLAPIYPSLHTKQILTGYTI